MPDFYMSARNVNSGRRPQFGDEPGSTQYLIVPDQQNSPNPGLAVQQDQWVKELFQVLSARAVVGENDRREGHLLFFVHGYKNSPESVLRRHRTLQAGLNALNFPGVVVSFDWPSGDLTLGYLEDRHDGKQAAFQLVKDGIALMIANQQPTCWINVHVLAHSMGAFVLREAFDDAEDFGGEIGQANWSVSQIALIGADVSRGNFELGNSKTRALFNHCRRLTNYSNKHDKALLVSNVKRIGIAPRVGRVALPDTTDPKAVNVDCSDYWESRNNNGGFANTQGEVSHSWHFGDPKFQADLAETLLGNDREVISTRDQIRDGRFRIKV